MEHFMKLKSTVIKDDKLIYSIIKKKIDEAAAIGKSYSLTIGVSPDLKKRDTKSGIDLGYIQEYCTVFPDSVVGLVKDIIKKEIIEIPESGKTMELILRLELDDSIPTTKYLIDDNDMHFAAIRLYYKDPITIDSEFNLICFDIYPRFSKVSTGEHKIEGVIFGDPYEMDSHMPPTNIKMTIGILSDLMKSDVEFNIKFVNNNFKFDNGILMEKSLLESRWQPSTRSFNDLMGRTIIFKNKKEK